MPLNGDAPAGPQNQTTLFVLIRVSRKAGWFSTAWYFVAKGTQPSLQCVHANLLLFTPVVDLFAYPHRRLGRFRCDNQPTDRGRESRRLEALIRWHDHARVA